MNHWLVLGLSPTVPLITICTSRVVLLLLDEWCASQQNTLFWNLFFKVKLYHWQRLTAVETTVMRILLPLSVQICHWSLLFSFTCGNIYLWCYSPCYLQLSSFPYQTTLVCVLCINVNIQVSATKNGRKAKEVLLENNQNLVICPAVFAMVAHGLWNTIWKELVSFFASSMMRTCDALSRLCSSCWHPCIERHH